jgi:Gram-negative porin
LTPPRSRTRTPGVLWPFLLALCSLGFARIAAAEKIIAKGDDWTVFTDGRLGAFLSYVNGDALPRNTVDASGNLLHDIQGGGLDGDAMRQPVAGGPPGDLTQGKLQGMRVRSGFIGNTLGIGVREPIGDTTLITGYLQLWSYVESESRIKNLPNPIDVRQGYVKVEGRWGSVLVGRARSLFSRGNTDIDILYGHRYGLGFPGSVDSNGPTNGQIGFGLLGSGFDAGIVYGTPVLGGFQLTVGAYDPIQLQGAWTRTKWVRPEAELTFEHTLGKVGKVVLFGNGVYQKLYQLDVDQSTAAEGVGYGGRLELGPLRLGLCGHYGRGLGLNYALEVTGASLDSQNNLRKEDGYYAQSQLVFHKWDIGAGWGISRVFLNPADNVPDPTTGQIPHSVIKYQMGISSVFVYHVTPALHFDVDAFRAQDVWFLGERQVVYTANTGLTFTW